MQLLTVTQFHFNILTFKVKLLIFNDMLSAFYVIKLRHSYLIFSVMVFLSFSQIVLVAQVLEKKFDYIITNFSTNLLKYILIRYLKYVL